jgi:hypothetical protein
MNLSGLHILLTYQCNLQCDHCFVWGSPWQTGVFSLPDLVSVLQDAREVESLHQIYFEGGEPFLYYPILVKGVSHAHTFGFQTGVVSNGYWATSLADACAWLEPLAEAGLDRLEISYDLLHGDETGSLKAEFALAAAGRLGLIASSITIDPPATVSGKPVTGGGLMFRGRAAEKLASGLPLQTWDSLTVCPYENLANPARVHLDPFGNLHLCQGLLLGNLFQQPLQKILSGYQPASHPVAGPLLVGGPAHLVRTYQLDHQAGYADACHLCYHSRQALRRRFPEWLAPDQMYAVSGATT